MVKVEMPLAEAKSWELAICLVFSWPVQLQSAHRYRYVSLSVRPFCSCFLSDSPSLSSSFDILSRNGCSADFATAERHHGGANAPMEGQRGMDEGQKKGIKQGI